MSDSREVERRVARRAATEDRGRPPKVKHRRCQQCGVTFPDDEVMQDHDEHGNPSGWFCFSCI